MSSYQKEQIETLSLVLRHLSTLSAQERQALESEVSDYLSFRDEVNAFLRDHFSNVCTEKCYQNKVSACCSREGIITFFGDVVVNALVSSYTEINEMIKVLKKHNRGFKCIYLGNHGCMWRIKPIVCEMFLCEQAKKEIFQEKPLAGQLWDELNKRKKSYTWPDRPVLFEALERYFIEAGYSSPLMYMHNSPGLLRVRQQAKEK